MTNPVDVFTAPIPKPRGGEWPPFVERFQDLMPSWGSRRLVFGVGGPMWMNPSDRFDDPPLVEDQEAAAMLTLSAMQWAMKYGWSFSETNDGRGYIGMDGGSLTSQAPSLAACAVQACHMIKDGLPESRAGCEADEERLSATDARRPTPSP